jgi:hypothetical protein
MEQTSADIGRERDHIGLLLVEARGSLRSRHDKCYLELNLACNGTYVDRRMIVNYACHLPILVPQLCLPSLHAHPEQTSGIKWNLLQLI